MALVMPPVDPTVLARRGTIVAALRAVLPADCVVADEVGRRAYECDALTMYRELPLVVVMPNTVEEVQAVLRIASAKGVNVVPRGGGTSLSGGSLPVADGILLSMTKFNRILEIDLENRCVRTQPGVANLAITKAVENDGFYYAPDPSSQIACSIGGNVSENAGGIHCLKYGLTTNNLLGLEIVLMNGQVVRLGGKHLDSDLYDVMGLFTGSEGLLGVITEVTVRILAKPQSARGGGVISADASDLLVAFAETVNIPVVPTLMAWGAIPDDHVLMAGMVGLQTSHRYGNATMLESDLVLGIGNRWANRHTGSVETYTKGRKFIHVDIEPTQIGRVFNPDLGIVSDAKAALELLVEVAREWRKSGKIKERQAWPAACQDRKRSMLRKSHFDNVPIKPQRVYEEMNKAFGRDTRYVSVIGLSQIAGAQFLSVYHPRNWINAGQAGPLGWTLPAALGVRAADPDGEIVALSGDYDFQFLIEELAVGAQFKLPYIHVVVNNSYLGLIRQAQRGFDMDYHVQLSFENVNAPELGVYGVDHVAVAEGLGCKAIRVRDPNEAQAAFTTAREWIREFKVPVVVEFILERVTNIAMGTEIDNIVEFEETLDLPVEDGVLAAQRPTVSA
jgi:glyoxylate carboligase